MPSPLIAKMQEIVDAHKAAGILTEASQAGERVRFFSKNGPKLAKISELGAGANQFIHDAIRYFANGTLSPPFSKDNISDIYKLYANIDKDLMGDPNGTDAQKAQHQEWQTFWQKQQQDYPALNAQLTTVQQEILAAYRFKTLSLTTFKPNGAKSTQQDEVRAQDFLQEINKKMRSQLSPADAYVDLLENFSKRFAHDLDSMVDRLGNAAKNKDWENFNQVFMQIQKDKCYQYLGPVAEKMLFSTLRNHATIIEKLPYILEKSKLGSAFIEAYPDAKQRQALLTQSLALAESGKPYPHRNPKMDKLFGKATTSTQDRHILLLKEKLAQVKAEVLAQSAQLEVHQLANLLDSKQANLPITLVDTSTSRPRANALVLNQFDKANKQPAALQDIEIIPQKPTAPSTQLPRHK